MRKKVGGDTSRNSGASRQWASAKSPSRVEERSLGDEPELTGRGPRADTRVLERNLRNEGRTRVYCCRHGLRNEL